MNLTTEKRVKYWWRCVCLAEKFWTLLNPYLQTFHPPLSFSTNTLLQLYASIRNKIDSQIISHQQKHQSIIKNIMCAIGSNWSVVFKISTALEKTFWSGSVRGLNVFAVPGTFRFGHFLKFAVGSVAVRSGGFKFSASLGPVRSEVLKFLLVHFFPGPSRSESFWKVFGQVSRESWIFLGGLVPFLSPDITISYPRFWSIDPWLL